MENSITIEIENCNNIKQGIINIAKNELNIKYAMNGTGKSTISKALKYKIDNSDLKELQPFTTIEIPTVIVSENIQKILIFDEHFINNIVFKEREVITNSFDVFIKSENYDIKREKINERLKDLKIDIVNQVNVKTILSSLEEVTNKITLNKDKTIKLNPFIKSVLKRENKYNIPVKLNKFKNFIKEENSHEWIDWKTKGFNFDDKSKCPFCTKRLNSDYKEEKDVFLKIYDKSSTKALIDTLQYFLNLEQYINKKTYKKLTDLIKKSTDESILKLELSKFIGEATFIKEKIKNIYNFDSHQIRNEDIAKLDEKVRTLKIDCSSLVLFNNRTTLNIFKEINKKIDNIFLEVDILKREVGALNGHIKAAIEKSKNDINNFLESAGITYEMDINGDDEGSIKTILKYKNAETKEIKDIKKHLSWGEKNAFALMLFMHYTVQQNAELIILDDPISSFDSTKKYAIMNRLFKKPSSKFPNTFYKKTVLMLTHDFEPVIDFIVNHKPTGGFLNAYYLKNNNGIIDELQIEGNEDIISQVNLLNKNIKKMELNILHRIIFFRKLIELIDIEEKDIVYNIISSLMHQEEKPAIKINEETSILLNIRQLKIGMKIIKNYIPDFSYKKIVKNIYKKEELIKEYTDEANSYLKLQIFRAYCEVTNKRGKVDDVVLKYVDNTYHIENDFNYCLDFYKFDIVPNYIVDRMDEFMKTEENQTF